MTVLAQTIFWICIGSLGYAYLGYPLLVYLVSRLAPRPVTTADIEPHVTVLITAYNEAASIAEKLENTLAIEYPGDKLQIIVASDGSTDGTDSIVKEYADRGVTLFRQNGRVGKTATQNNAVQKASGEIILFSDATTLYQPDVLAKILPAFADPSVGCAAGRLIYVDPDSTNVGKGARSYWSYETFIKSAESRACSLIGASGCLYAVRRTAYAPMYAEACSDFLICSDIYRKGLRSVFVPDAVCYEHTNRKAQDELQMRVRVISQTLSDLWRNRDIMNPFKFGMFAVEMVSHKVLRYGVPLILILLLGTSLSLAGGSPFFAIAATLQVLFYVLAIAGGILEFANKRLSLLAMPLYFMLANVASVVALYKCLRGEKYARWEPVRESH